MPALFPEVVLDEVEVSLAAYMPEYRIVRRGPKPNDPSQTIGLRASTWAPDSNSFEMPSLEPTLMRYYYEAELMVKSADEPAGRELYTLGGKTLRAVLYRDTDLRVRLSALQEDLLGSRERFKRLNVDTQKFLKNDVKGSWFFVCTTRFWVETESGPTPP